MGYLNIRVSFHWGIVIRYATYMRVTGNLTIRFTRLRIIPPLSFDNYSAVIISLEKAVQTIRSAQLCIIPFTVGSYSFKTTSPSSVTKVFA